MNISFEGKIALVTGALEAACDFVRAGAAVLLSDVNEAAVWEAGKKLLLIHNEITTVFQS